MSQEADNKITTSSLSAVLPAFNEEKNIEKVIRDCFSILPEIAKNYEVIVVDDGSTDGTLTILNNLKQKYSTLKIIRHSKNKGYGAALKTGLLAGKSDYIFFMDSDDQFDIREIKTFLPFLNQRDLIIGYRINRQDHWLRLLNAYLWKKAIGTLFCLHVKDINCAFKIFTRNFLHQIQLNADGAFINTEILLQAKKMDCRIEQIGVHHYPRKMGKPTGANLKVILKAFWELFKYYKKYR